MVSLYVARQSGQISCIFLNGVSYQEAQSILDFIYNGEALIENDRLARFLSLAENLKIEGLSSANVIPNGNNIEKENFVTTNKSVVHEIDCGSSLFLANVSSTPLQSSQIKVLSQDENLSKLQASREKSLNLQENVNPATFQSLYDANKNTGSTCHIPLDILHSNPTESITIKEESSDPNGASAFACNADEYISVAAEKCTDESRVIDKKYKKKGQTSIVWEYFNTSTSMTTFICKICGKKVKCSRAGKNPIGTCNLWHHLRSCHVELYNRTGRKYRKNKTNAKKHTKITV
jgi:hypothetical protein